MPDENTPAEPEFRSAADVFGIGKDRGTPTAGLSQSPGLRNLDNSKVTGADRSHVVGPQQSAVDPVLAGLDTGYNPMTRAEARAITRHADGETVIPPADTESEALPGPSSTSAPAAPTAPADAARVTPTVALATTPGAPTAEASPSEPPTELPAA